MSLKWPYRATFIRHAMSSYNELKVRRDKDSAYQKFKRSYVKNPESARTKHLAQEIAFSWALPTGDHNTLLAEGATDDAVTTGRQLGQLRGSIPDVIFVSPYHRTHGTLKALIQGWPELANCEIIEEERVREQEHGLQLLYNDRRLMFAMHPEQRMLYEREGEYWYRYPQGENVPDVRDRTRDFLGMLIREFAGADVLVVTHHLAIMAFRANLERMGAQEFMRLNSKERPINCGVTTYVGVPDVGRRGEGKFELQAYNERLF